MACFIKRWSIETTFEESRAHLPLRPSVSETWRLNDHAVSTELVFAGGAAGSWPVPGRSLGGATECLVCGGSRLATLWQGRVWKVEYFSTSTPDTEWVEIPRVYLQGLMSACYRTD